MSSREIEIDVSLPAPAILMILARIPIPLRRVMRSIVIDEFPPDVRSSNDLLQSGTFVSLYISLYVLLHVYCIRAHIHARARARAHTHTHTHTQVCDYFANVSCSDTTMATIVAFNSEIRPFSPPYFQTRTLFAALINHLGGGDPGEGHGPNRSRGPLPDIANDRHHKRTNECEERREEERG